MKKFILIFSIAALSNSATVSPSFNFYQDVYICDSRSGKKYHFTKNCRGLNACKAPIKKLSFADAKKIGKDLCGGED